MSSKCHKWIARAEEVSNQLSSSSLSSIEAVLFLRAGRECAAEIASFLMLYQRAQGNDAAASSSFVPAHRLSFTDILRLHEAKNTLLKKMNVVASKHDHSTNVIPMLTATAGKRSSTSLVGAGASSTATVDRQQQSCNEELETLLRVRSLLAVENMKMDQVVASISEGSAALAALHERLEHVDATLTYTQTIVKGMLRVKTLDDVVLRLSWLVLFAVVLFVWGQRIFGLGVISVR